MRIEMVGPPAVGKTSIVRALADRGIARGPKSDSSLSIPSEWRRFAKFILGAYKDTSHEHTRLPIKSLEGLAAAWVGDQSEVPMVFDESVILNGFSMETRYPGTGKKYFTQCPLPGVLVALYANDRIFKKRNHRREMHKGRNRFEKSMRFKEAIEEYMPIIKGRGCCVLEYDTGALKIGQIADDVYEKVMRMEKDKKRKRKR